MKLTTTTKLFFFIWDIRGRQIIENQPDAYSPESEKFHPHKPHASTVFAVRIPRLRPDFKEYSNQSGYTLIFLLSKGRQAQH